MVVRPLVRPLVRPSGPPGFAGWAGSPRMPAASGGVNGSNIPAWAIDADLAVDYTTGATYGTGSVSGMFPPSTDTHAQTIYAPDTLGFYQPFATNIPVRTNLGLQTVPTRTNALFPSDNFAGSGWTATNMSVQTDQASSIISGLLMDRLVAATGQCRVERGNAIFATSSTYRLSGIFKTDTGRYAGFGFFNGILDSYQAFDLQAGTVSTVSGTTLTSASITSLGSGAFLCEVTWTTPASFAGTSGLKILVSNESSLIANSLNGAAVWCANAQAELGAAFATPPIITTTGTATVNGNQQVISGLGTQLATGVAGLLQFRNLRPGVTGDFASLLSISDGTTNNTILQLYRNQTGFFYCDGNAAGVNQYGFNVPPTQDIGQLLTFAFTVAANFAKVQMVGQTDISADTVVTWPVVNRVNIGTSGAGGTPGYQYTRKLALDFLTPSDDPATKFAYWYNQAVLAATS